MEIWLVQDENNEEQADENNEERADENNEYIIERHIEQKVRWQVI